jgi:F-type H+-transporting ATPase subunit b
MPQFNPADFAPQIIWLAILFGLLYLVARSTLPRVEAVMEDRRARIAGDLAAAERAKADAASAGASVSTELSAARTEAAKATGEARAKANAEIAAALAAAEAGINARAADAEAQLARARAEAATELDRVAAEAAAELVAKVAGLQISNDVAEAAVRKVAA